VRSLVVTTWFPDAENPSRTPFCFEHASAAKAAGVDVSVIHVMLRTVGSERTENYRGISVTQLPLVLHDPRAWLKVIRTVRRQLAIADVLHTMAFSSVLVAALPWLLRRRPWVHTEHWNGVTSPESVAGWWRRASFVRHVLRLPHHVTAVTCALAASMTPFTRRQSVSVLPCVVRTPPALIPFPGPDPLRLVGVGLLIPRKEPLLAVETIGWLRDKDIDVQYDWVGSGPLAEQVQRRVHDLALVDNVRLLGSVDPGEVQPLIAQAHMFFVPSRQENFFTAVAESIAAGRPAVVPRSGGFVDYCRPENSELVDGWRTEDLGAAILRMRTRLTRLAPREISRTIDDEFSVARVGELILTAYARAAERQSRGSD
jgi:glycosyltransferase involved in cell wall biosynthesis